MSEEKLLNTFPRVSVVMAVYNEPIEWMCQAIDSILNQTFTNFEFIIVNDNPYRVANKKILKDYSAKDSRIVAVSNEENIGLTKSLNIGLDLAKGEFIARMDADDISKPERLEKQVSLMEKNRFVGICGTAIELFGTKNDIIFYPEDNNSVFLFLDSCFAHPTVMMRRSVASLRYDENCRCAQDYELWCRAFALGVRFCNLQIPLLYYRCSDQQISSSRRREQEVIAQKIRRKAYDDFSKKQNLGVSMTGLTLTLDNILLLYEKTDLPHKEKSMFLYYLLLSNQSSVISVLLFVCKHNKLYRHLPIINLMRVLYHTMKGSDIRKY